MTTTQTLPLTSNTELLTLSQQSTQILDLPKVEISDILVSFTPAVPLQEHTASTDELATNFSIYDTHLAHTPAKSVRWLWEKRLPLSGLTLLDGDHGCGKSLLALQIAASVSSGSPMSDGSPTIQGGVAIITPHTDANTTQLQSLTALGADLSRIQILSFIPDPSPKPYTGGYHPFSLPGQEPLHAGACQTARAT